MKRERIARLLPEVFQRTLDARPDVLGGFLDVIEILHQPDEDVLEHLDAYLDPQQTLDAWLPFLAAWVDLDRFLDDAGSFPGGPARLRSLIMASLSLAKERGTRQGLCKFLETATGLRGFEVENSISQPYHIIVTSPAPGAAFPEMREDQYCAWLTDLISSEKPAYVTCKLQLRMVSEKRS